MKTLRLLALSVTLCTAVACSDDDLNVSQNGTDPQYTGTYNLSKVMVFDPVDFNMDGTANNDMMLENTCYAGSTIVLNADGTYQHTNNNVLLESESGCSNETFEGTWEVDGSDILMTNTSMDVPLTTENDFTGSEIIVVQNNGIYPVRDAENNAVYQTGVVTYTFTKS